MAREIFEFCYEHQKLTEFITYIVLFGLLCTFLWFCGDKVIAIIGWVFNKIDSRKTLKNDNIELNKKIMEIQGRKEPSNEINIKELAMYVMDWRIARAEYKFNDKEYLELLTDTESTIKEMIKELKKGGYTDPNIMITIIKEALITR